MRLIVLLTSMFVWATGISGCGGMSVVRDYALRTETNEGLIIGSATFDTFVQNDFYRTLNAENFDTRATLIYRQVGSSELKFIETRTFGGAWDHDLFFEGNRGQFFAIELPAGQYEFIRSSIVVENSGADNIPYWGQRLKPDFSVPFTVESGKAAYLGEVNWNVVASKYPGNLVNFMWQIRSVTGTVKDSYDRDIELMTKLFKNIKPSQIEKLLISVPVKPNE